MRGVFRPSWPRYRPRRRLYPHRTLTPDPTMGSDFDGTNDQINRGANLTGAVDSDQFVISFWLESPSSAFENVFAASKSGGGASRVSIGTNADGTLFIQARNDADTLVLDTDTTTVIDDGEWHHVCIAGDASGSPTVLQVYVDGVDDSPSGTFDGAIDFGGAGDWAVGGSVVGAAANRIDACIGEFYMTIGETLDLASNIGKFYSAGAPVSLGADGSTPTGTQPILYLSGDSTQFVHNFGSGGDFTVTGALGDCALPSPSTTYTATVSIGAAIQAQRDLAATLSAAIQAPQTAAASVDAAVAQALSAIASADAAVQATRTATFTLDAALLQAMSADTSVDAVVAAAQQAAASIQAAVQTPRTTSAAVGAAVQALITAQLALDGVVQAAQTATASLDANVAAGNTVTADLSAAVQAVASASASLQAAILGSGNVSASLSAGVAAVRSVAASVDAVIAATMSLALTADAAILGAMTATASLDARITAVASLSPSTTRTLTLAARDRTHTAQSPSRSTSLPARTRSH